MRSEIDKREEMNVCKACGDFIKNKEMEKHMEYECTILCDNQIEKNE